MLKHFRVPGRLAVKLKELGISIPAVLHRAGLTRDLFDQTRVLVSTSELFALWRAIEAVSSDPLIGLKLGVETKTERFHPMGIAALSTQNLVAAAEHMARYKKLTAPEEILIQLDEEEFSIGFRWLLAVDAEPQVLTDYCFAWMISIARHGTGTQLSPLRVEYVQQRANLRPIERHFGCKVIGGASHNAIIFRSSDATAPFVTRNAELLDLLAPQFEEQLRARGIVHQEQMNQVLLDADQALRGVGDNGRERDDESNERHCGRASADPHQNERSDGDDGHGLQQDGVGIKHSPHPA